MNSSNKNIKLYRIILIVFFVLQLSISFVVYYFFNMTYTGIGFGITSFLLLLSYFISLKNKFTLSVNIFTQIYPIVFIILSIIGKLNNEGTSLVYYIAPRFGILVVILIPFLVFGTKDKKKLFLSALLPILWFATFDYWHSIFHLNQNIQYKNSDYPLVILGSSIILIISILMIYFVQDTNEQYEKTILEQQKNIEKALEKISQSINYARRIQNSLLQGEEILKNFLADYFIIYKPKETVSGDFYWIKERNSKLYIMAADCTGHGVPGAFVSMLGFAFLNEIFITSDITAAEILENLSMKFKKAFGHDGKERQDGMDAALCIIDLYNHQLNFAGANNPLFQIRDNKLTEYKPTTISIGLNPIEKEIQNIFIDIKSKDRYFIFSDGYADQFGGTEKRKISKRKLKELLLEYNSSDMNFIKNNLENYLDRWMNGNKQTDDILIIGLEI